MRELREVSTRDSWFLDALTRARELGRLKCALRFSALIIMRYTGYIVVRVCLARDSFRWLWWLIRIGFK